jgi:hypothetical protein
MPTSDRLVFPHLWMNESVSSRTAVYGPVRTVVWQGSGGDRRPYADQVGVQVNWMTQYDQCKLLRSALKHGIIT